MKGLLQASMFVTAAILAAGPVARADDKVVYTDPSTKKEASVSGKIQGETPGAITIQPGIGASRDIPAADVIDVQYEVPGRFLLIYRNAQNAERESETATKEADRAKALAEARKTYKGLLRDVTNEKAKRQMEFKVAELTARESEGDRTKAPDAIELLQKFLTDHPDGWQVARCATLLADLQIAKEDYAGARKTFEKLVAIPDIPKELRQRSELKIAEMMVRAKEYAKADEKLRGLAQDLPADSPQTVRVNIVLAESQAAQGHYPEATKSLEAIIAQPMAKGLKAQAYNTLGDCYLAQKKWKDAMWNYLYVDVIYHQNHEQHAKALYQLYKIFKDHNDDKKAKQCLDQLVTDKQFAGTEYQRLALQDSQDKAEKE